MGNGAADFLKAAEKGLQINVDFACLVFARFHALDDVIKQTVDLRHFFFRFAYKSVYIFNMFGHDVDLCIGIVHEL